MSSKQIQIGAQTQTEVTPKEQELTAKLYAALRQLRMRLTYSAGDGVMSYHLFRNATLIDISRKIPRSKEDLLMCYGIGNAKLIKYGDHILETIESTICEYYDVERQNTSNGDENKSIQSADTIFGAQLLTELAKSCKKKFGVAKAKHQSTPLVESRHEADQGETFVAASRQGRKRKNIELEEAPNFNNSSEERAEDLSSGPISVPSRAETSSPRVWERFLVSFPPASEAPDIMSRMCPLEFTTALRHLSSEKMRIEATRSFALTTCHVGNLLASHEVLEDTNSRRQALIDELYRENNELSKSTSELKGEIEKLKSALLEKEERELKLKAQLREAKATYIKNMAEAKDAWKREFLQSQSFKRRIIHFDTVKTRLSAGVIALDSPSSKTSGAKRKASVALGTPLGMLKERAASDLTRFVDPEAKKEIGDLSPVNCMDEAAVCAWKAFQYSMVAYTTIQDWSDRSDKRIAQAESQAKTAKDRVRVVEKELALVKEELQSQVEEAEKRREKDARTTSDVGTYYCLKSRIEMMEEFAAGTHVDWDVEGERANLDFLYPDGNPGEELFKLAGLEVGEDDQKDDADSEAVEEVEKVEDVPKILPEATTDKEVDLVQAKEKSNES